MPSSPRLPGSGGSPTLAASAHAPALAYGAAIGSERDEGIDYWIEALRSETGAVVSAFSSCRDSSVVVERTTTRSGTIMVEEELSPSSTLEAFLVTGALRLDGGESTRDLAYLEAPVTIEGHEVGSVSVVGATTSAHSARRALSKAARAIATELALRLAMRDAEGGQQMIAAHNIVHDLIARVAPLPEVLTAVTKSIEALDPSVIACVVLLDRKSSTLHPGAGPSLPSDFLAAIEGVVIGPNVGTCGSAAWTGNLTISEDLAQDPKWAPMRELAENAGLRHCWSMPIVSPDDQVLGTLALYGTRPRHPSQDHLNLLEDWARVVGIAIERHSDHERLNFDARHDSLTGLLNRMAIFESLDEVIAHAGPESQAAVLFIDLDGLKTLNDSLGHDRVDEILREIGERLLAVAAERSFVGRFGGDEFLIVAEQIADDDAAALLGLDVLEAVSRPLPFIDSGVITASIGITMVRSNAAGTREVIRESDAAMYSAKRSGRDRCAFYSGAPRLHAGRRLLIERELRGAEKRGELRLEFQPIARLPDSAIVGVEALLRWHCPSLGELSPSEFIPIAEDTGAILAIGAWVLRESCETIVRVAEATASQLELAVNVSARQISNPGFAVAVQQTLAHTGLPAELLQLEITETALVQPNTVTTRVLQAVNALGAQIVLDDFGTGFSSLSWLKQHPFGAIKIDRNFIGGLPSSAIDKAIVSAVITIAKALSCTVVAEGVESAEQLASLSSVGCGRVQGFYIARPCTAEQLVEFLSNPDRHPRPQWAGTASE